MPGRGITETLTVAVPTRGPRLTITWPGWVVVSTTPWVVPGSPTRVALVGSVKLRTGSVAVETEIIRDVDGVGKGVSAGDVGGS